MPRREKKYHYLYKTTNLINEKFYVGMHSTDDLNDGYLGSGKRLKYSINKYGRENFKIEFLEFFEDRKKLVEREENLVNEKLIKEPLCMNLKKGGTGGLVSVEHGKKLSESGNKKLIWLSENDSKWIEKTSKNRSNGMISAYKKGTKIATMPDWNGKTLKEETKKKIGIANSKHQTGNGNSQFGTCWVYKNKVNKKIKKTELNKYLEKNWIKGRKMS